MADRSLLTVYIVDDDAAIRDSLVLLLGLRGYRCACYADAESFLTAVSPEWVGCVVADLRMPGMSGLDMQRLLHDRGHAMPFVMITAHGDVAAARRAFKFDAVDFLEKPFDDESLIAAIETAFRRESERIDREQEICHRAVALDALTEREREVAGLLIQGHHNRAIAEALSISPRTVEVHKAHIFEKTGARGLADLIRIVRGD